MKLLEDFENEVKLQVGGSHGEYTYSADEVITLAVQTLREVIKRNLDRILGDM